jgi:hypothetical protein
MSNSIITDVNSELCSEVQREHLGCHACYRSGCFVAAANCHARCRKFAHVCRVQGQASRCISCDKACHLDSSDPRCDFFAHARGLLPLHENVDAEQLRDTQAGTGGSVPHFSQVPWAFTNDDNSELIVNGILHRKGYGCPGNAAAGEMNNCLIDSLRQTLDDMQCDRRLVRRDLQNEFGELDITEPRRHVTHGSYLDVELHWRSIIFSLFRHNISDRVMPRDLNEYRIVALCGNLPGNGIVLGNRYGTRTLVVVNWGDVHFDPCFPINPDALPS